MSSKYLAKLRHKYFHEQKGLCYYCENEMILWDEYPKELSGKPPWNLCTLEHLYSRFHPKRRTPANGEQRYAAACYDCNQRKGREDEVKFKRQWRRSQGYSK